MVFFSQIETRIYRLNLNSCFLWYTRFEIATQYLVEMIEKFLNYSSHCGGLVF